MRKWHRWLSILFGIFAVWIVTTGLASQIVPIVQRGGFEEERREAPSAAAAATIPGAPEGFVCPETLTCRPKARARNIVGLIHHLHSGESFGPVGQILFILTGFALMFFALSGLWMYIDMYRGRLSKAREGKRIRGARFFWD